MKMSQGFIVSAVLVLATGLAARGEETAVDPARQVAEVERAFARTMAERDHDAFTEFLSEEAVFLGGDSERRGRAAVSEHWRRYFSEPEAPFSWAPERVVVLDSGSLALSTGPVWNAAGERTST